MPPFAAGFAAGLGFVGDLAFFFGEAFLLDLSFRACAGAAAPPPPPSGTSFPASSTQMVFVNSSPVSSSITVTTFLVFFPPAPAPLPPIPPGSGYRVAIFAGGCFWCMEKPFDILPGVIATTSGYTGGVEANPRYHDVGGGKTGHRESGAFS